jgi:glycosyltransferase involved in cell wall biosynthesis
MVSIILPVYNGEAHLEQCIRSVLAQTIEDIQLILINDGSVDGTAAICDRYAAEDRRVMVIHQENAGVSAARNAGLQAATGEYIGFVDADDYIAPDMYEQALNQLGDHDMVMWDAVTVWPDGKTQADTIDLLKTDSSLQKKDWSPDLLRYMAGAVWRCLYRRELLEDVRFPVGIKLSEDRLFNLEAMGKAQSLAYFKQGLYYRVVREGSACNRYHGDKFEKSLLAMEYADKIIEKYWAEEYRAVYVRAFVIDGALAAIREICSREYPGKGRLKAIRSVAEQPALKAAFTAYPPEGLREKLLNKKMAGVLWIVCLLEQLKNG